MLFSIVTVHLNHIHGLRATQESLLAQTNRDFEWIVIDGGSNHECVAALHHLGAIWISEPDHGIYDAMNKGIERASGRYLLFLNAGDRLAGPDVLAKIADAIGNANPDFVYGDAIESGQMKPARDIAHMTTGMITHHQAMLYNRSSLSDMRYDVDYRIAGDYKFTADYLSRFHRTLYCPFPICDFEPGGLSQRNVRLGRIEQFRARAELKAVGLPANAAIYAGQSALMALRRAAPGLYWAIKRRGKQT